MLSGRFFAYNSIRAPARPFEMADKSLREWGKAKAAGSIRLARAVLNLSRATSLRTTPREHRKAPPVVRPDGRAGREALDYQAASGVEPEGQLSRTPDTVANLEVP